MEWNIERKPINFVKEVNHNVSYKALSTLKEVMLKQDDFGVKKYGTPLSYNLKYDWMQMFLEEMADGLKYIQNEIDRKKQVIGILEHAIEFDDMNLVADAVYMLKMAGTGKEEQHG